MRNQKLNKIEVLVDLCMRRAEELSVECAVAGVDRAGHIVCAKRDDLCPHPPLQIAHKKAATAAIMGMPTQMITNLIGQDETAIRALSAGETLLAVPGGSPVYLHNKVIGGVGVAGDHYSEDQAILEWALDQAKENSND